MQSSLFDVPDDEASDECLHHDLPDAGLLEFPNALSRREADRLFQRLSQELPCEQVHIRIAGRVLPVPRLQCWIGDQGSTYGYSGIRMQPLPWPAWLAPLRERVETLAKHRFNAVLANLYRTGTDSVSWHSDDEPELGATPVVASLSLGATRVFELKHKTRKDLAKRRIALRHGSLLIMGKGTQNNWLHQIPKDKGTVAPRVNLTFRSILLRQGRPARD